MISQLTSLVIILLLHYYTYSSLLVLDSLLPILLAAVDLSCLYECKCCLLTLVTEPSLRYVVHLYDGFQCLLVVLHLCLAVCNKCYSLHWILRIISIDLSLYLVSFLQQLKWVLVTANLQVALTQQCQNNRVETLTIPIFVKELAILLQSNCQMIYRLLEALVIQVCLSYVRMSNY
jgi:hypothetical protein